MNLAILIAVAALVGGSAAGECRGYYQVPTNAGQVLKDDVDIPYQLAIDRDTNTLFFSYTTGKEENFSQSVYVNLKDRTSGIIPGIASGFAHAYDSQHQIVYIGGIDGIYKFDYNSKKAVKLNITDSNIWQMFYKDGLYFTVYPDETSFVYKDNHLERVTELKDNKAKLLAVDKENNIYFVQDGTLKRVENGKIIVVGDYGVNAFNTDTDGNLYFSIPTAIYKFSGNVVKKVASFLNIFGFAFEGKNQIIYGVDKSVVQVTLTPDMCSNYIASEDESSNNVNN